MEIKVFENAKTWHADKPKFVSRVANGDVFDFTKAVQLFKSILGEECVIIIIAV